MEKKEKKEGILKLHFTTTTTTIIYEIEIQYFLHENSQVEFSSSSDAGWKIMGNGTIFFFQFSPKKKALWKVWEMEVQGKDLKSFMETVR